MQLALYKSFEEEIDNPCKLCKTNAIDPVNLGNKHTIEDVTAHHFCLVGSLKSLFS